MSRLEEENATLRRQVAEADEYRKRTDGLLKADQISLSSSQDEIDALREKIKNEQDLRRRAIAEIERLREKLEGFAKAMFEAGVFASTQRDEIVKLRGLLQECWDDVGDFMEIDVAERVKREVPEP